MRRLLKIIVAAGALATVSGASALGSGVAGAVVAPETIASATDVAWAKRKGHKWKAYRGRGHKYGWRHRGRHFRYAYPRRFHRPAYRYRYARPIYYGRPAYSYRYARPAYGRVVATGSPRGWGRGRHRGWRR